MFFEFFLIYLGENEHFLLTIARVLTLFEFPFFSGKVGDQSNVKTFSKYKLYTTTHKCCLSLVVGISIGEVISISVFVLPQPGQIVILHYDLALVAVSF